MPTILLTGSTGFIIGNLLRKMIYEKAQYRIVSIDRVSTPAALNNIYQNKNHTFYMGDISDSHFINNVFAYEKPDYVINGAAEASVDASLTDPNSFIKSNCMGIQVLLNAAVKYGVKKFLHVSTDEVYGALNSEEEASWTEESPLNPRNPYAASKACSELLVNAAGTSFGLPYLITRSSNNYGNRQTADKLIPRVIKCALEDKPIPVYGQGLQIRDWTYVQDNCSGLLKALEDGTINETYNIAANCETSNIEIINRICNLVGKGHKNITFIKDPRGNAHDFRYSVNTDKIRRLGWKPEFSFKDGLENTVNWYMTNQYFLRQQ